MAQRQIILQQPTKAFLRRQNFPREPDKKLSKKTYTVVSFFSDHANIHAIIHAKEKRANFIFSLKSDYFPKNSTNCTRLWATTVAAGRAWVLIQNTKCIKLAALSIFLKTTIGKVPS
jgi:hypothetical protein